MKKQSLLFPIFVSVLSFNVYAGNTYVGGSLSMQNISATGTAYRGFRPGVLIGYGGPVDKDFYVAGEFNASYVATLQNNYINRNNSLRMAPVFSLSVIPGMLFTPTAMGYFRLGVADGLINVSNNWKVGWVLGLGIEAALSPCWSVRTEYDYTVFHAISAGNPNSDEFVLSFKYTFDA